MNNKTHELLTGPLTAINNQWVLFSIWFWCMLTFCYEAGEFSLRMIWFCWKNWEQKFCHLLKRKNVQNLKNRADKLFVKLKGAYFFYVLRQDLSRFSTSCLWREVSASQKTKMEENKGWAITAFCYSRKGWYFIKSVLVSTSWTRKHVLD